MSIDPVLLRPPLNYPDGPYHTLLARTVERFPDKVATVFHHRTLTFREIDSLSNALARALLGLGVEPGDRIALFSSNRPEYLITFEAASKVGAVITPINPAYREQEVAYQLADAEPRVVVVHEEQAEVLAAAQPSAEHILCIGRRVPKGMRSWYGVVASQPVAPLPPVRLDPGEDLIALPYSSGTTGLPKGTMLTHRNLVCNHTQCTSATRMTERDVLLIFLPFYHIYGTMLMGAAVASGATQVIMERFALPDALELMQRYRVTLFYAVPPVLLALSQMDGIDRYDWSSVRFAMSGAAPLPSEVGRRFEQRTGVRVLQGYGLTEASPLTHMNPTDDPAAVRLDSVGIRVSDQEERIVDLETGEREVGPGEVGELLVRGPHVMKGYWRAPEATEQTLAGGWLHTGDIARRDGDGYVYIVDRRKEMIKYKGFGVAPAELEAALHELPAVADCAVVPKPDPEAGEIPYAFVVLRPGIEIEPSALLQEVNRKVAGYKQIRGIEIVEAIPKNPSGKILRRVLRERLR